MIFFFSTAILASHVREGFVFELSALRWQTASTLWWADGNQMESVQTAQRRITVEHKIKHNQDKQCTCKVTLRRVRVTIVAVPKQAVLPLGKPEGKRPLWRPRRRWEDKIKVDPQEVRCGGMDWIELAQDRDKWRAIVTEAMNLRVP
jgi:hypothetical protein